MRLRTGGTNIADTDVMSAAANYVSQTCLDMTGAVDTVMTNLSELPSSWTGAERAEATLS